MEQPQTGAICLIASAKSPYHGEWGFIYEMKESGRVGVMLDGKYKAQFGWKGVACCLQCPIQTSDEYEPYVKACKERNSYFKSKLSPEIIRHMDESKEWEEMNNPVPQKQTSTPGIPGTPFSSTDHRVQNLEERIVELHGYLKQVNQTMCANVEALRSQVQSVEGRIPHVTAAQPARKRSDSPSFSESSVMSRMKSD